MSTAKPEASSVTVGVYDALNAETDGLKLPEPCQVPPVAICTLPVSGMLVWSAHTVKSVPALATMGGSTVIVTASDAPAHKPLSVTVTVCVPAPARMLDVVCPLLQR